MTLAIEAVGLVKRFGKTLAVDGVDLTGFENLLLIGRLLEVPRAEAKRGSGELLERFGLSSGPAREAGRLSYAQQPRHPGVEIGANIEGSPFQPVRGPGGPGDRGSPRSASGSRPGPDCGARGRCQPERLEEAQGPDGSGAPADHGPRGGGRRRRARRGRCGRGRRRSRVRLLGRGGGPGRAGGAVLVCADAVVA